MNRRLRTCEQWNRSVQTWLSDWKQVQNESEHDTCDAYVSSVTGCFAERKSNSRYTISQSHIPSPKWRRRWQAWGLMAGCSGEGMGAGGRRAIMASWMASSRRQRNLGVGGGGISNSDVSGWAKVTRVVYWDPIVTYEVSYLSFSPFLLPTNINPPFLNTWFFLKKSQVFACLCIFSIMLGYMMSILANTRRILIT